MLLNAGKFRVKQVKLRKKFHIKVLINRPIFQSLVDEPGLEAIQRSATLCKRAVEEERWTDATNLWSTTEGVVMYRTHFVDFYNILKFEIPGGSTNDFGISKGGIPVRDLPIRRDNG
jgi:hypothetical protein